MTRTRSKPIKKSSETVEITQTAKAALPPSEKNPPKLFVLPKNVSKDARIVTLPNPAASSGNRYYHCPETGIYEFVKVAAPRSTPRSLLFTSQRSHHGQNDKPTENPTEGIETKPSEEPPKQAFSSGYITRSADLFVTTPVDLLFFLLPILSPSATKDHKKMFLTFDDHIDTISGPLKRILQSTTTRTLFEKRLWAICDTVEAGNDIMFRLSVEKLAKEMVRKSEAIVKKGLPASLEARFVRQTLQAPVLNIKRENSSISIAEEGADAATAGAELPSIVLDESTQATTPSESTGQSQTSAKSLENVATSMTSISTAAETDQAPSQNTVSAPESIIHLLRLRTALSFTSSSYLPPHLRPTVQKSIEESKLVDFEPLDAHMKHLDSLREQARALRSLSDNISRKRALDDDEANAARAEKKQKKEEEDKRKKAASKAVKDLKKVNTSGMKKMSSFFTKIPK